MQRLKKINFAAMAFILGSGLALSTSSFRTLDPNVYNANTTNPATPNWVSIPAGHDIQCDDNTSFSCEGYRSSPSGPVTVTSMGKATLQ